MQSNNRLIDKSKIHRRGFTLIEILVVIGIISVLIGASLTGFSKMMKSAEKARTQELISNAVTALSAIYEADGMWPKLIRTRSTSKEGLLDQDVALILAKRGLMSLSADKNKERLVGNDRFGILTPWAAKYVERMGDNASLSTRVTGGLTGKENILNFAVDLDGDGEITSDECGGRTEEDVIRATVVVWCVDKGGKTKVKSWTKGRTQKVQ